MKKIYKYHLLPDGGCTTLIGKFKQFLDVQVQNDEICIWAIVDDELSEIQIDVYTIGTGWTITDDYSYFRTVQQEEFVWHVFFKKDSSNVIANNGEVTRNMDAAVEKFLKDFMADLDESICEKSTDTSLFGKVATDNVNNLLFGKGRLI